jgi:hypothetical protein
VQDDRDYVLDNGAKPGYVAYTYPHPLQGTSSSVPVLTSPADMTTGLSFPVVFDWEDFTDAIKYELQVDDSGASFPSPEIDVIIDCLGPCDSDNSTYSADDDELSAGTHYWWRVRALQ